MASKAKKKYSLRLADFSDRELLLLVQDHQDEEGWADALEIATTIWPKGREEDYHSGTSNVGSRFAYLRRQGVMERDPKQPRAWRLTDEGEMLASGELRAAQEKTVIEVNDFQLLALGTTIGERYLDADEVAAVLLRRSWEFAREQRRRRR